MKRATVLIISIVLFYCNISVNAQTNTNRKDSIKQYIGVSDLLNYMTEIAANKQKYINHPLSDLLNDLKIPVTSFYVSSGFNRFKSSGMALYFDKSYDTAAEKWNGWIEDPVSIIVEWTKPLSRVDIETILQKEAGEWTPAAQKYFENETIRDIVVPYRKGK